MIEIKYRSCHQQNVRRFHLRRKKDSNVNEMLLFFLMFIKCFLYQVTLKNKMKFFNLKFDDK